MRKSDFLWIVALCLLGYLAYRVYEGWAPQINVNLPLPTPTVPAKKPLFPRGGLAETPHNGIQEAGPDGPNHDDPVTCYLDPSLRLKNVGGRDGAGLCVFTSITHSGRYQNVPSLWNFQEEMRKEDGGGYPEKVTRMIKKYAPQELGDVLQYEGEDPEILKAAIQTGRMPGVTYNGHDMHYGWNQTIAHMVNLIQLDDKWACILDNNFIGDNQLVWLPPKEFFKRWKGGEQGWAVILLNPPPPPSPWNS